MNINTRWIQGNSPFPAHHGPTNLSRALENFVRHTAGQTESGEEEVVQSTWTPVVDVRETDAALELYVELPGVSRDDIDISLENNLLTVSGERRFDHDEERFRRVERVYGKFHRAFRTPRDVDGTKVSASYKAGVLHLELPKTEAAKPRQIEIA